jgi:hypothetical protein
MQKEFIHIISNLDSQLHGLAGIDVLPVRSQSLLDLAARAAVALDLQRGAADELDGIHHRVEHAPDGFEEGGFLDALLEFYGERCLGRVGVGTLEYVQ